MKIKHNILIIGLLILLVAACNNDETCRKSQIVKMNVFFYKDTINNITGDTVKLPLSLDSLTAYGLNRDSILYKKSKGISSIQLPLNSFAEESKFVLKCNKTYDTLTVGYTNKNEYQSLECGSIRVHTLEKAFTSGHFFQHTYIGYPDVNTTSTSANVKNITIHHFIK